MCIKASLGKLVVGAEGPVWLFGRTVAQVGYPLIGVTLSHLARLEGLPPLHRDPFDRLLVAQALAEDRVLVTGDGHLAAYGVSVLQARR